MSPRPSKPDRRRRDGCIWIVAAIARAALKAAVADKPAGKFMIRSRTRVVKRHLEGWVTAMAMSAL
jgi:hypothetical protein